MNALGATQANVETIRVELGARSYDVLIGPGLIARAGQLIRKTLPDAQAIAVVTDGNVATRHLPRLRGAVCDVLRVHEIGMPPGESSKSFAQLEKTVEKILEARLERGDAVVAFGGGVVGDLAGFAAAIARRGMAFVQLPTTLLAQVDASVGGKTGINSPQGKNLIGAFHQPRLVLADTEVLATLPPREFAAGYAEIVKAALICDASFFAWLEKNRVEIFFRGPALIQAIAESVRIKARVVASDERESGDRALLNLGHTFAHALEAACRYHPERLIHGEAVAIGTVLSHEFSAAQGHAPAEAAEKVREHLRSAGLPTRIQDIPHASFMAEQLLHYMAQDKKVKAGRLTFILTRGIGRAFIANDVPMETVRQFLQQKLAA
jgi:3-dehydroquinate synthase